MDKEDVGRAENEEPKNGRQVMIVAREDANEKRKQDAEQRADD